MSQTGKIQLVLSPQAERYVRRDAPVEVRRMAARGALPLAPVELATVLFATGRVAVRLRYRQVYGTPCRTAARLARVFALRGWTGVPRPCSSPHCDLRARPTP